MEARILNGEAPCGQERETNVCSVTGKSSEAGCGEKGGRIGQTCPQVFYEPLSATLQDFDWWSGLPVADVRNALEMIKPDLVSETIGSHIYWLPDSLAIPKKENSTHLLPAFDEYLISYKDRRAALSLDDHKKSVSNNGIFWPVVLIDGQVTGRWKRSVKTGKVVIEKEYFRRHSKAELNGIEKAANTFSEFFKPVEG